MCKVFLFGSFARGDADGSSDTDVLIVYERGPSPSARQRTRELVATQFGQACSFAEYTRTHLAKMFAEGHLFAWHLYLEAKQVCGREDEGPHFSFPQPAPYTGAHRDASRFIQLLGTCERAVARGTSSLVYEAGVGYVAIRNIGISLSALALPQPAFDRHVAFKVATATCMPPPCDADIFDLMVAARHSSQRGLDEPILDSERLLPALAQARAWAENALEIAHDSTLA